MSDIELQTETEEERPKERRRQIRWYHLFLMLIADAWCFFIMEYVNNPDLLQMKWYYMLLNTGGIFIMNLIAFFWFNSLKRSVMLIHIIWSAMAIVFFIVYAERGEPLQVIDFFSIRTAATVAGSYTFRPTRALIIDIMAGIVLTIFYTLIPFDYVLVKTDRIKKILMRIGVGAFMIAMYPVYLNTNWNGGLGIMTDLFAPIKTYHEYGTTVGFFCVAKYMRLTPPDGYSARETEEIARRALLEKKSNTITSVKPVNIIAIMNESWADLNYAGKLNTTDEIMPYYDSMQENTIKGHTLVCITGGGTAKTEYEFLTGNSVRRFPGMVPYVSYFTQNEYSLVSTLEAQGFETAAMHPYKGSNWNREAAYSLMGFDRFYTQDDFDKDVLKYHGHISDQANYEKIIDVIDHKKSKDQPLFLFDVTMQNHGGYSEDDIGSDVTTSGIPCDEAKNYLTLEKLSDRALQYLIGYFRDYDEPTIIVMFGDHYPTLPDYFTSVVSGGTDIDRLPLDEKERWYATPFFIWANYDIPEKQDLVTSTNYLGTMMLENTGWQMADYNYYLKNLEKEIPALNHLGYLGTDGHYHSWKKGDAGTLHSEWEYECLQYTNLKGHGGDRLPWFFSLDEKK
ncbi:MAG: LTA synthase family protein [Lachnospiraceae bacterium]|nr:LTA synthase family protein [Lachnospiraceae bacterium]MDY2758992.1 LTA synthase family protein [Lachnospiraceae bacterium]